MKTVTLLLILKVMAVVTRGPHHPHRQVPIEHKHYQHTLKTSEPITADSEILQDIQHINADVHELTAQLLSQMSPEELEFHYFTAHDFDRNSKLDGLELLKAVYHTMENENNVHLNDSSEEPATEQTFCMDSYIEAVDRTLETDDTNNDGFVSYAEYRAARARNPEERTSRVLLSTLP